MSAPTDGPPTAGFRFSPWNLLLLVPFLTLVTPWFNADQPRLGGMPFFYWTQFAFVPVGVFCVGLVHVMTTKAPNGSEPGDPGGVDAVDGGARR